MKVMGEKEAIRLSPCPNGCSQHQNINFYPELGWEIECSRFGYPVHFYQSAALAVNAWHQESCLYGS